MAATVGPSPYTHYPSVRRHHDLPTSYYVQRHMQDQEQPQWLLPRENHPPPAHHHYYHAAPRTTAAQAVPIAALLSAPLPAPEPPIRPQAQMQTSEHFSIPQGRSYSTSSEASHWATAQSSRQAGYYASSPPANEPQSAVSERLPSHAFPRVSTFAAMAEPELEYTLVMRQQPRAARACGFGERDRRVIDPPPIIEVKARDIHTGEEHIEGDNYATLHCVLVNAVTGNDESHIVAPRSETPLAQRLMGQAVASPWVASDEHGVRGSFFVFADLSVRSVGTYRLLFRLLKISPMQLAKGEHSYIRATVLSEPFEVYTAKEFPGMRASSALLRALRAQGLNVGVKKGSGKAKPGKAASADDSDAQGEDEDEDAGESDSDRPSRPVHEQPSGESSAGRPQKRQKQG